MSLNGPSDSIFGTVRVFILEAASYSNVIKAVSFLSYSAGARTPARSRALVMLGMIVVVCVQTASSVARSNTP